MATTRSRPKKSKHDTLIKSLIGYGIAAIAIIFFGIAASQRGGASGGVAYALTVLAACLIAFLGIAFLPKGSRWFQVGLWGLPVSLIVVASLHWYGGGWLFGYLLGILLAGEVSSRRHRRSTQKQFGGRILLFASAERRSKPVACSLTLTAFRERLSQLGNEIQPVLCLCRDNTRLDIFGQADGALVLYATLNQDNDSAWNRLTNAQGSEAGGADAGSGSEVTVQVGENVNGVYQRQSVVNIDLVREAGEYFIRNGALDPSLDWETGEDVINRLPPTRLRQ